MGPLHPALCCMFEPESEEKSDIKEAEVLALQFSQSHKT